MGHGTPSTSSASSGRFSAYHQDSAFGASASETKGGCRYDVEELFRKKKEGHEVKNYFYKGRSPP